MKTITFAIAAALAASSAASAQPSFCAAGYHVDRQGNCQPDVRQYNRYCAPGNVYEPFPGGWRCVPAGY
jgi:hypothetical protein